AEGFGAHAGGDGIVLLGLVQGADGADGAVEQSDLCREGIAEKAGNSKGYVDAGAAQPRQGHNLVARNAEGTGVPGGAGTDQGHGLGDVVAAGAHIGGAPDRKGGRSEVVAVVLEVTENEAFGGFSAELPSTWRGDGAGIDGVEIAAGGQDIEAAARRRAGGAGGNEFAVQRIEKGLHLGGTGGGKTWLYNGFDRLQHCVGGRPIGRTDSGAVHQFGGYCLKVSNEVANAAIGWQTVDVDAGHGGENVRPAPWIGENGVQGIETELQIVGQGADERVIPGGIAAWHSGQSEGKVSRHPSLWRLAENVQAIANLGFLQIAEEVVDPDQRLGLVRGQADILI